MRGEWLWTGAAAVGLLALSASAQANDELLLRQNNAPSG